VIDIGKLFNLLERLVVAFERVAVAQEVQAGLKTAEEVKAREIAQKVAQKVEQPKNYLGL
jgi:hypothetical protein